MHVLRIISVAEYVKKGGDISDTEAVVAVLKAKLLGPTIKGMNRVPYFDVGDIALLERAKDARNFIAHDCANLGWPLSDVSARLIHENLARLRREVESLTAGDNVISRCVFEIDQKEPAPPWIQQEYPQWVQRWIFGSIDSGQIIEANEDKRTLSEKLDALCSPAESPSK